MVTNWGTDWETGPARELGQALWRALTEDERRKILPSKSGEQDNQTISAVLTMEGLGAALTAVSRVLGKTPLLIFDQFDDYQSRHRTIFLPATRKWLSAADLRARNRFWALVSSLLKSGTVHAIFVTRTDAGGLSSVQFLGPVSPFHLDRVKRQFVGPLLQKLTEKDDAGPVIANPERGWERLADRIVRDLARRDGSVLPQQLKTALAGLQGLKTLNVARYEQAGGVVGLEALFVESQISGAARKIRVNQSVVRSAAAHLIDPSAPSKTRTAPVKDIVRACDLAPVTG